MGRFYINIISYLFIAILVSFISSIRAQSEINLNDIIRTGSGASSSSSASSASADNVGVGAGPVPPVPQPGVFPPQPPPAGFPLPIGGAGAGFHKSLDFSLTKGFGPLLGGLLPGIGLPPPPPPPIGDIPPPPIEGGPGYMGFPGFLGPSYIPYSWLGSALGAKGDLLFPVVLFIFVIVGVWTVVNFLLALVVPLIAGKLAVGKALIAKKFRRSLEEEEEEKKDFMGQKEILEMKTNNITQNVLGAIEKNSEKYGDGTH